MNIKDRLFIKNKSNISAKTTLFANLILIRFNTSLNETLINV